MEIFDILRFEVDKRQDILIAETYTEVGDVSILGAELGTYEYGFSITLNFDQANKSEFIRFSLDGGVIWSEFQTSVGNSAVDTPVNYDFFKEGVSGDLNIIVEVRKEDATGIMNVLFADAYIRRAK